MVSRVPTLRTDDLVLNHPPLARARAPTMSPSHLVKVSNEPSASGSEVFKVLSSLQIP